MLKCKFFVPATEHHSLIHPLNLRHSVFHAHSIALGIYLRPAKWEALEKGDLSGAVVHPAMVYLSLLTGGVYYLIQKGVTQFPVDLELQLHHALATMEQERPDPVTLVQIYCLIAWYVFFKRDFPEAQTYLSKCWDVVRLNHLRIAYPIMNTILGLGEPDHETQEQITALCQMVYLDKSAELVLKIPPVLPKEFDEQVDKIPVSFWTSRIER